MHFRPNGGGVHICYAGIDVAHGPKSAVDVAGISREREAIRYAIGNVNALIESIPNVKVLGAQGKVGGKLLVNALLNNYATGGGATLSGGAECAPQHSFQGKVKIGVIQNNDGVLPAHLQRARLKAASGR